MKKGYKETQLQLLLSPAILLSSDKVVSRTVRDRHLNQGHLMLSGLQVKYLFSTLLQTNQRPNALGSKLKENKQTHFLTLRKRAKCQVVVIER